MKTSPPLPVAQALSFRPREWLFVAGVIAAVLIVTTLPYIFASQSAPADQQFVGFILNTSDHAQYLSWYKAFQSQALIPNLQTSEPNPPVFFNLLWWGLAQFGKLTGFDYTLVYQIFRWAAGAFFLVMTYVFTALFFPAIEKRRLAFSIVAFGAGLGWIFVLLKYALRLEELPFPQLVQVAEGNSFLCVLAYPHFAEAAGLILAVFALLLVGERRGQLRFAVYAGLTALFLGWQHGYDLIIVWIIPCAYGAALFFLTRRWPDYWFKAMLITGLISWPPALYSVLLTRLNPIWKEVLAQFDNAGVFTPNPLSMLVLMGLPLLLALGWVVGWLRRGRQSELADAPFNRALFLVVWLLAGWALTYIPTDFQIHMISSWQIPIALLAALGIEQAAPLVQRRLPLLTPQRLAWLLVGLMALTNVYLYAWRFLDLSRYTYPYYLHTAETAAMDWLDTHSPAGAVVLSSYDVGRYIPGLSGRVAFLSHWAQTVDFFHKRDVVAAFFDAATPARERLDALDSYAIDYIFFGPAERALGGFDPGAEAAFALVFDAGAVQIYEFVK